MWGTPPKFYIGFNREKSRNFPKSLWRLKYWILRSETWTQSSLGSKMGGRSKNFDPSSNIKGAWPKTSKIRNLTFFDIKSIIFELGSKFLDLPLCFQPQGYPWGQKHRDRTKNFDPSSNIMNFMVKNVKMRILDVLGHAPLNIWARINIFEPTPPPLSTPRMTVFPFQTLKFNI